MNTNDIANRIAEKINGMFVAQGAACMDAAMHENIAAIIRAELDGEAVGFDAGLEAAAKEVCLQCRKSPPTWMTVTNSFEHLDADEYSKTCRAGAIRSRIGSPVAPHHQPS
jgi:hypothetical protein